MGKTLLLHIPRTGGSTLRGLLQDKLVRDKAMYVLDLVQIECGLQAMTCSPTDGRSYVFFVRDPVKHFVSRFLNRRVEGKPLYEAPHLPLEKELFARFKTPDEFASVLGSSNRTTAEA